MLYIHFICHTTYATMYHTFSPPFKAQQKKQGKYIFSTKRDFRIKINYEFHSPKYRLRLDSLKFHTRQIYKNNPKKTTTATTTKLRGKVEKILKHKKWDAAKKNPCDLITKKYCKQAMAVVFVLVFISNSRPPFIALALCYITCCCCFFLSHSPYSLSIFLCWFHFFGMALRVKWSYTVSMGRKCVNICCAGGEGEHMGFEMGLKGYLCSCFFFEGLIQFLLGPSFYGYNLEVHFPFRLGNSVKSYHASSLGYRM